MKDTAGPYLLHYGAQTCTLESLEEPRSITASVDEILEAGGGWPAVSLEEFRVLTLFVSKATPIAAQATHVIPPQR